MINANITELLDYAAQKNMLKKEDETYIVNRILNLIGGSEFERMNYTPHNNIEEILDPILDFAAENGKLEANTVTYRDILSTDIMDCFTPLPSAVTDTFYKKYDESPKAATEWFFDFSKNNNYIMTQRLKKNIVWKTNVGKYGDLDITINLSKPEKSPDEIAAAKTAKQTGYPKCLLCVENVGYEGGANHPPRSNHRVIPVDINGETWCLQYSPYGYYNEHCILLNSKHSPMAITNDTFNRLLAFVEKFPHYFIGSNADLPIVGGSILTHDHYQGGNYEFPMAKCGARKKVVFEGYEDIEACIVDWALSTVRVASENRFRLSELAGKILAAWREYSDEENEILAHTDAPHNTITPIARMRNGKFELDLILRNNRTTREHPLGIFHPHSEYHHIKKENIGLIEAMGLAVLPPRLLTEFDLNDEKKEEIGKIFGKILENCGVFKDTPKGNDGFEKFIKSVR